MSKIASIAALTLREALRQKLAVNLLVFAVLLIAGSITISELTFGEQYRIISDLTLTSAQIFGTLIAVFVGGGLVAGDLQRRTLFPVLAKPVSRTQYVVGRYLGLLVTLTLNLTVMAAASLAVLAVYTGGLGFLATSPFASAFVGVLAQLAVVSAIAIFFSAVTNSTLAAIFTLFLTFAGHLSRGFAAYWEGEGHRAVQALSYVIPGLAALDYKVNLVYQAPVPLPQLTWTLLYAGLYATLAIALAALLFNRRDLH